MQGLASAARARDYINHLETKVNRETAFCLHLVLERELKDVWAIEAKIQRESTALLNQVLEQQLKDVWAIEAKLPYEAWTVITEMDTIMLKNGLSEAGKFQAEMNKPISYQKSGRLDWETNEYKLQAVVTKNTATCWTAGA